MPVTNCPHCGHQVGFGADALCPHCRLPRDAPVTREELALAVERLAAIELRPELLFEDEIRAKRIRSLSALGLGVGLGGLWALGTFVPPVIGIHAVLMPPVMLHLGFLAAGSGLAGLLFHRRRPF